MDASSSSANFEQGRQKRLLPSRARRGGSGVLGCDIDIMILEAQKWKQDSEHLIAADTPFLLTSNSAFASSSLDAERVVNTVVNERYFNRPQVIKAYREQTLIETPKFFNIADVPPVGGRFRPREADEAIADTSDVAYEKRHRKYEGFEKRQRYREKEKLQYEHYKLKERIEQLRSMDSTVFLSLPASAFSPIQGTLPEEDPSFLPGIHANGSIISNEGERRRKEMLDTAGFLDERYRTLLPPPQIHKKLLRPPEIPVPQEGGESESEDGQVSVTASKENERLRFKLPPKSDTTTSSAAPSPAYYKANATASTSKKVRLGKERRARRPSPVLSELFTPPPAERSSVPIQASSDAFDTDDNAATDDLGDETQVSNLRMLALASEAQPNFSNGAYTNEPMSPEYHPSISYRPSKRIKQTREPRSPRLRAPSLPLIESISTASMPSPASPIVSAPATRRKPGPRERKKCILLQVAQRYVSTREKQPRHTTAFGVKLPAILNEAYEFELPLWVWPVVEPRVMMTGLLPDGSDESEDEDEGDEVQQALKAPEQQTPGGAGPELHLEEGQEASEEDEQEQDQEQEPGLENPPSPVEQDELESEEETTGMEG